MWRRAFDPSPPSEADETPDEGHQVFDNHWVVSPMGLNIFVVRSLRGDRFKLGKVCASNGPASLLISSFAWFERVVGLAKW